MIHFRNLSLSTSLPFFNYPYCGKLGLTCILALLTGSAWSQTETLTDGNSSVTLNLTGSASGMNSWTVDGQNQLSDQWFYYRLGSSGTATSMGALTLSSFSQPAPGFLTTTYSSSHFSMQVVYSLVVGGTGSGTSSLSEQIKIQNLTSAPLAFNFFQYANFQLGGSSAQNNQMAQLGTGCAGLYNEASITSGNGASPEYIDIAINPGANNGEAGLAPDTLNNITGVNGYNLNNVTGAGLGDTAFGLQWTNSIAARGTMIISEGMDISGVTNVSNVPEPATWSLAVLGLAVFVARRSVRAQS